MEKKAGKVFLFEGSSNLINTDGWINYNKLHTVIKVVIRIYLILFGIHAVTFVFN